MNLSATHKVSPGDGRLRSFSPDSEIDDVNSDLLHLDIW